MNSCSILFCLFFLFIVDLSLAAQKTWYISPFGSDSTGDGTVSNPYATVSTAYNFANAGDIIQAEAGNYAGSANLITIRKNITIQSEKGASCTIFTAQNTNIQFYIYESYEVNFIGIQIISGTSTTGVLLISNGIVNIQDCIFGYNTIGLYYSHGTLTIDGTTFQNNVLAMDLIGTSSTPVIIKNSLFTNNGSPYGNGGGIYASSASISVQSTVFQSNVAKNGAGIYLYKSSVSMSSSKMFNNTATDGAAFMCTNYSALSLFSTIISDNTADIGGAGECSQCTLYVDPSCQIEDNTSTSGNNGQCTF